MTTWTSPDKTPSQNFLLKEDLGYFILESALGFLIQEDIREAWVGMTKNVSTGTYQTKNTTSWSSPTKN